MSYCELILFRDGQAGRGMIKYGNSWGGAARVWSALFDKYLKDPAVPYDNWMVRSDDLWALACDPRLTSAERAVLLATFDLAIVKRENFGRYVAHLREFIEAHPTEGCCHLAAWAAQIADLDYSDGGDEHPVEAVGLYATSVSDNPWFEWDEDQGEGRPYNLRLHDRHFEVYGHPSMSKGMRLGLRDGDEL